jgi:hypothetical protein
MVAVYFKATKDRFIIYSNTENRKLLYWINSTDQSRELSPPESPVARHVGDIC